MIIHRCVCILSICIHICDNELSMCAYWDMVAKDVFYLITLREGLSLNLGVMTLPRLSGKQTRGSSCLWLPPPHPFTHTDYNNLKEHLASFCRCSETTKNIIEEDSKILAQTMAKAHQIKNWNQTPNLLDTKGNNKKSEKHPSDLPCCCCCSLHW